MTIFLSIIGIIILSFGFGLFIGYLLYDHPCKHQWVLLEQHSFAIEQLNGGRQEMERHLFMLVASVVKRRL